MEGSLPYDTRPVASWLVTANKTSGSEWQSLSTSGNQSQNSRSHSSRPLGGAIHPALGRRQMRWCDGVQRPGVMDPITRVYDEGSQLSN